MHCPHCHTQKLSRSHSRGIERMWKPFGIKHFRCDICGKRFSRFRIAATDAWLTAGIVGLCLLAAFLLVRSLLFYL